MKEKPDQGDGAAKFLFEQECQQKRVLELSYGQYVTWAVRYVCLTLRFGPPVETESMRKARVCAEMSKELENAAGEYGDVHFQDLVGILGKNRSEASGPVTKLSKLRAKSKTTRNPENLRSHFLL